MSVILSDAIQVITPEGVNLFSNQITKIVQHLEELFKLEDTQIKSDEVSEFLSKLSSISERVISTQNLVIKILILREFQNYSKNSRLKYSNSLPESFIKELESLEKYSEVILNMSASQLKMLSALLNDNDELENIKTFYNGLVDTQQVLEKNLRYLPEDIIEVIKIQAIKILKIYQDLPKPRVSKLKSQEIEEYLLSTKNAAKAIIWEIDEYKKNPPQKFQDLDELWSYWDRVFDEDEMESTSEALIGALNETRLKQGRPKLFE